MADWNSGPTYSLFGIDAAAGSPLGGLFGFAQDLSGNFAKGNAVATANPGLAVATITGQANDPQALVNAYQQGQYMQSRYTPFQSIATTIGNVFGTGIGTVGGMVGTAGTQAAPGVAGGASQAGAGVATVGVAGALGAVSGSLKGALSGIGVGLNSGSAGGATGGISNTYLYVAGGLALIVAYLALAK